MKIINLNRLNNLATLVSRKRMALFKINHSNQMADNSYKKKINFKIPFNVIENFTEKQKNYKNNTKLNFKTLDILYENLSSDYAEVLKYLGLSHLPFVEKLKKLNKFPLSEIITNYEEIKDFDLKFNDKFKK